MDLLPIASTFLLILVAELGDKTQLTVMSLACQYKPKTVFLGAMLGFLAVDGVSALIGGPLLALLPIMWVRVVAGVVFIVFGITTLLQRNKGEGEVKNTGSRVPLLACFSLVSLMELGDKTQIITITLAAENQPWMVLAGLVLAFAVLTGIAVVVGAKFLTRLPMKWLKIGTGVLFIVLGALTIAGALFGFNIL